MKRNTRRTICALCGLPAQLRNSHIVPEFLYQHLYNDRRQILGVHGQGTDGGQRIQKGLRDYLLCEGCEQLVNERYEKTFRLQWVVPHIGPHNWLADEQRTFKVDYTTFKLFHISVLFRASVSTAATYRAVNLGLRHTTRMREMLMSVDPGPPSEYAIRGVMVVDPRNRQPYNMVSAPRRFREGSHTYYGTMYAGVEWWVRVSSHRDESEARDALAADGTITMQGMDFREFATLKLAGMALRGEI